MKISLETERVVENDASTPADGVILKAESKETSSYQNPIIRAYDENAWRNGYGIGDPFVMRYNGRYYLYCSTRDWEVGIKCFVSDDLVNWHYQGLCAEELLTKSAYAPEVVYYNGSFYMYTSPAGHGHYVLKSDSPTGPFTAITGNYGLSIDGDVFIDDDGKWYFYCAGEQGIMAYTMSAPDKVDAASGVNTGAYMNGWTEGSMILKYNDRYFITYTGNHVWCSGYRIDYAVSKNTPTSFISSENNPILLSTNAEKVKGIGHSSTVLGPDLDGYYIVYHSAITAPKRQMNIDRIVLNGDRLEVLGPTVNKQMAPMMPEVYSRFENEADLDGWNISKAKLGKSSLLLDEKGYAVSKTSFNGDYTAEINMLSLNGKAGVVFDYKDEDNHGMLCYDAENYSLSVSFTVNGKTATKSVSIEGSFGEKLRADELILFTIRKSGDHYQFLVNNRMMMKCESELSGGAVGVAAVKGEAEFGFVGISSASMQSGVKRIYKPITGTLPAITCVEKELLLENYNNVNYVSVSEGEAYNYLTNVSDGGSYDLSVTYRSEADAELMIYQNGISVGSIALKKSAIGCKTIFRGIRLGSGKCALTFKVTSGSADILSYEFTESSAKEEIKYDFTSETKAEYEDGNWKYSENELSLLDGCGKWLIGDESWGDYVVEADVTPTSDNINFGILVRAKNPSLGGANNSVPLGTNFVQGYFVGLGQGKIFLGKQNYNWKEVFSGSADIVKNETYHLKVEVSGEVISVWVDDVLMIEYADEDAFVSGRAGFRGHFSSAVVNNFTVRTK